jgi:TolB-like protein
MCLAMGVVGCIPHTYAPSKDGAAENEVQLRTLNPDQRYIINEPLAPLNSHSTMGRFNARIIFLADQIERNADRKNLANTVIVTSFTNLNKISETTSFGRLVAESLMHELQVRKWQVYEIRLSKDISINESGEFSLSRDIAKLKDQYKIGGIVTGTYSVVDGNLVVNARVIDMNNGIMISSAQTYMPANWFTDTLLYNEENMKPMKIIGGGR